jgi:hypothetical protein
LFLAQNSHTEKAKWSAEVSWQGKQSCELSFQVTLAIHCPTDAKGCQCSNVHKQFVFLEQIHNTELCECQKDSKHALNIEFTQRGHQLCTLYHGISVCFNKPSNLGAEMRSTICSKYTQTDDLEQNSVKIRNYFTYTSLNIYQCNYTVLNFIHISVTRV